MLRPCGKARFEMKTVVFPFVWNLYVKWYTIEEIGSALKLCPDGG